MNDYELILSDLLGKRGEALKLSNVAETYRPALTQLRDEIAAIPEVAKGKPLVELLGATDRLHDAYGLCLWHFNQAMKAWPDLDEGLRGALDKATGRLVPTKGVLSAPYPTEVAAAKEHRKQIAEEEVTLKAFPLPGEHTLYDVAQGYVTQGERLGELISERVDIETASSTPDMRKLRARAMGLLSRMRQAVVDEVEFRPELPRDLEAQLFGYLDELAVTREAASNRGANTPSEPTPTEPTPS